MATLLDDIYFTTGDVASLIGVTRRNVILWCNNGVLRSVTKRKRARYISVGTFIDFLYVNPKYQKDIRNKQCKGDQKEIIEYIIEVIDSRPRLYSVEDLMDIFNVSGSTVRHWKADGQIVPYKKRPIYKSFLYDEDSVRQFSYRKKKYEDAFTRYLESEK